MLMEKSGHKSGKTFVRCVQFRLYKSKIKQAVYSLDHILLEIATAKWRLYASCPMAAEQLWQNVNYQPSLKQ